MKENHLCTKIYRAYASYPLAYVVTLVVFHAQQTWRWQQLRLSLEKKIMKCPKTIQSVSHTQNQCLCKLWNNFSIRKASGTLECWMWSALRIYRYCWYQLLAWGGEGAWKIAYACVPRECVKNTLRRGFLNLSFFYLHFFNLDFLTKTFLDLTSFNREFVWIQRS